MLLQLRKEAADFVVFITCLYVDATAFIRELPGFHFE